jgi:5-methylcytosine-specific restriction endonuclease McrA
VKRSPMRRRPPKRGPMDPAIAEAVLRRDGGCVAHRWGYALDVRCQGRPHVHHRRLRAQGGADTLDNLITLCERHHDQAHNVDRAGANAAGIILSR